MPCIFLGVKFKAYVFFWVHNMKLHRTPRNVYCDYSPWGNYSGHPKRHRLACTKLSVSGAREERRLEWKKKRGDLFCRSLASPFLALSTDRDWIRLDTGNPVKWQSNIKSEYIPRTRSARNVYDRVMISLVLLLIGWENGLIAKFLNQS